MITVVDVDHNSIGFLESFNATSLTITDRVSRALDFDNDEVRENARVFLNNKWDWPRFKKTGARCKIKYPKK